MQSLFERQRIVDLISQCSPLSIRSSGKILVHCLSTEHPGFSGLQVYRPRTLSHSNTSLGTVKLTFVKFDGSDQGQTLDAVFHNPGGPGV